MKVKGRSVTDSIQGRRFPAPPTKELTLRETQIIYPQGHHRARVLLI